MSDWRRVDDDKVRLCWHCPDCGTDSMSYPNDSHFTHYCTSCSSQLEYCHSEVMADDIENELENAPSPVRETIFGDTATVVYVCKSCNNEMTIKCDADRWEKWRSGKEKFDDILPDLWIEEQNMVLSGFCKDCFKDTFGDNLTESS